jgi:dsDNA-binding SOS-regulon protein
MESDCESSSPCCVYLDQKVAEKERDRLNALNEKVQEAYAKLLDVDDMVFKFFSKDNFIKHNEKEEVQDLFHEIREQVEGLFHKKYLTKEESDLVRDWYSDAYSSFYITERNLI